MNITIDEAGRVVIPKAIREAAGWSAKVSLTVRVVDGTVELEPAPRAVTVERRGRVVRARGKGEALRNATVERTRAKLRDR